MKRISKRRDSEGYHNKANGKGVAKLAERKPLTARGRHGVYYHIFMTILTNSRLFGCIMSYIVDGYYNASSRLSRPVLFGEASSAS